MDFHAALAALRRYWRSILVVVLLVAGAGVGYLMSQKPVYASTAVVNFLPKSGGAAGELKAAMEYAQSQAETFAQLAGGPRVLDPVLKELGMTEDYRTIAAQCPTWASATQAVITIECRRGDPESAAALANAIAKQIGAALQEYAPPGTSQTLESLITQEAFANPQPVSPNLKTALPVPLALGLGLGLAQALVRAFLSSKVETPDTVARISKAPVLGEIPLEEASAAGGGQQLRRMEPFSLRAEAYRRLRTNLQFRALEGLGNVMVVTSSVPGEGKTATASAIATSFGQTGQRVLLVDCDLRRPRVHTEFQLDNSTGLSTCLLSGLSAADVAHQVDGIDILTSGPKPPNPAELLGSPAMRRLYDEAKSSYDVVVFDSPPLLPVTDATVLSRMGAGAIVVADTGRVRIRQLATALKNLSTVEAPVLGIVLNKIKVGGPGGYYGYGYQYRYSYDYHYATPGSGAKGKRGHRKRARSAKAKSAQRGQAA